MTFSIVARCPRSGEFGISAITALPAVGTFLTHAAPGAGAVATQARLNPYLGIDGVRLLQNGMSAHDTIEALKQTDPRMDRRQLGVVDRNGGASIWTGENCKGWAGGETRQDLCVLGNRLVGPQVIEASVKAFLETADLPLVDRLVKALATGMSLGGDRKEERSATVFIVAAEEYPLWDIRVDDHDDPVGELKRLQGVFGSRLLPHIRRMATRTNPAGVFEDADV
ncbi:DUF1028 domain-containing protein [Mesorhizobium sp. CAU 1741]|uniref:DUF1028 domain-containing protein n=1 Tax=Mesorhizobium sp. CAU 1741 TaxID=3140366 RepID=UPI00325AAED0